MCYNITLTKQPLYDFVSITYFDQGNCGIITTSVKYVFIYVLVPARYTTNVASSVR